MFKCPFAIFAVAFRVISFSLLLGTQVANGQISGISLIDSKTGAVPFNTTGSCPTLAAGDDCSESDDIVRTFDVLTYTWSISVDVGHVINNVVVKQTLPDGMEWIDFSSSQLGAVCLRIGVDPLSTISPDGRTVVCNLGTLDTTASALSLDINAPARVRLVHQSDGSPVLHGETVSSCATLTAEAATGGVLGPFYSATVTNMVSAAPKLDIGKTRPRFRGLSVDPDANETGAIYTYIAYVKIGDGKGAELVTDDLNFVDSFDGYPAGTKLYDWDSTSTRTAGCGINYSGWAESGWPYGSITVSSAATELNSVPNSGVWSCADVGTGVNVSIVGADLSADWIPERTPANSTINITDNKYLVSGWISIWVPVSAVEAAGCTLSVTNSVTDFDPFGVSDLSNYDITLGADVRDEPTANNAVSHTIVCGSGGFSKRFLANVESATYGNTNIVLNQTQIYSGDGAVVAGQHFTSGLLGYNGGVQPLDNYVMCDVVDNRIAQVAPRENPPLGDDSATRVWLLGTGDPAKWVVEYAVGIPDQLGGFTNYYVDLDGDGGYYDDIAAHHVACDDSDAEVWYSGYDSACTGICNLLTNRKNFKIFSTKIEKI